MPKGSCPQASKVFPEGRVGVVLSSLTPLPATHELLVLPEALSGFRVVEVKGGESPLGSTQSVPEI